MERCVYDIKMLNNPDLKFQITSRMPIMSDGKFCKSIRECYMLYAYYKGDYAGKADFSIDDDETMQLVDIVVVDNAVKGFRHKHIASTMLEIMHKISTVCKLKKIYGHYAPPSRTAEYARKLYDKYGYKFGYDNNSSISNMEMRRIIIRDVDESLKCISDDDYFLSRNFDHRMRSNNTDKAEEREM